MLKFMLISICERDIAPPEFFDSLKVAHAQMEAKLLEQIGSYDSYTQGDDYEISEYSAWANPHCNSDWMIFPIAITGNLVSLAETE